MELGNVDYADWFYVAIVYVPVTIWLIKILIKYWKESK